MVTRHEVEVLRNKGLTFDEIGKKFGVSRQRAHQIFLPKKNAARQIVKLAVGSGILSKPVVCSNCGKQMSLEAHHSDYDKPLEVSWLCIKCHKAIHTTRR